MAGKRASLHAVARIGTEHDLNQTTNHHEKSMTISLRSLKLTMLALLACALPLALNAADAPKAGDKAPDLRSKRWMAMPYASAN